MRTRDVIQRAFYMNYNLDATTYKYQRIRGPFPGPGGLLTSGSNVAVTAKVAGQGVFSPVKIGDILWIRQGEVENKRKVATYTSPDAITVDSAIDLENGGAGYASWDFLPVDIGAAVTDGWHRCSDLYTKQVSLIATALGETDGITFRIEGQLYGPSYAEAKPVPILITTEIVVPKSAEPWTTVVAIGEDFAAIRVGVKATTAATGTDDISAYLVGSPKN